MSGSQQQYFWGHRLVKTPSPKTAASIFAVEADEETGWRPEYVTLITRILSNKIFAESRDYIAVTNLGGRIRQGSLTVPHWNTVRQVSREAYKRQGRNSIDSAETFQQQVSTMLQIVGSFGGSSSEAIHREVVVLGNFGSYSIRIEMLAGLIRLAESHGVMLTFIFPDNVNERSELQRENYELAKNFLDTSDYYRVHRHGDYLQMSANKKEEKSKWALPRNFQFEIAPSLKIPVQHWVRNRRATLFHIFESYKPKYVGTTVDCWVTGSGEIVNEGDIKKAYEYGDKLVFVESSFETAACLKVIAFYPRDQIHPAHLIGDGCSIILPQPNDKEAEQKFGALLQSLYRNNTIALCARVWQRNCRLGLFAMVPDLERGCLISVEHCFSDDLLPLPTLPPLLIKSENEDCTQMEKDNLIDELINQKCIPDFTPERGYVNPLVTMVREKATNKILHTDGQATDSTNGMDTINEKHVETELLERLKVAFPLVPFEAQATQAIRDVDFVIKQENHEGFGQEIKQESSELSEGYAGIMKQEIHDIDDHVVGQQVMQEEADLHIKQETVEDLQVVKDEFDVFTHGD